MGKPPTFSYSSRAYFTSGGLGLRSREPEFRREFKCAESDSVLCRAVNFYFLPSKVKAAVPLLI